MGKFCLGVEFYLEGSATYWATLSSYHSLCLEGSLSLIQKGQGCHRSRYTGAALKGLLQGYYCFI